MTKYIDADEFKNGVMAAMTKESAKDGALPLQIGMLLCGFVDNAPAADVQEVNHGHWIDTYVVVEKELQHHYENFKEDRVMCSRCSSLFAVKTNYCPNCGAKMDGDAQ